MNDISQVLKSIERVPKRRKHSPILMGDWEPYNDGSFLNEFLKQISSDPFISAQSFYLSLPLTEIKACRDRMPEGGICFGSHTLHSTTPGSFTEKFSFKLQELNQSQFVYIDATKETAEEPETINRNLIELLTNDFPAVLKMGESMSQFLQGKTADTLQYLLQTFLSQIPKDKLKNLIIVYHAPWLSILGMQMIPRHISYAYSLLRESLNVFLDEDAASEIRVVISIPEFTKD